MEPNEAFALDSRQEFPGGGSASARGHPPVFEIKGKEPMFVTKLSDDPYLSIGKARMIAANLDIAINF